MAESAKEVQPGGAGVDGCATTLPAWLVAHVLTRPLTEGERRFCGGLKVPGLEVVLREDDAWSERVLAGVEGGGEGAAVPSLSEVKEGDLLLLLLRPAELAERAGRQPPSGCWREVLEALAEGYFKAAERVLQQFTRVQPALVFLPPELRPGREPEQSGAALYRALYKEFSTCGARKGFITLEPALIAPMSEACPTPAIIGKHVANHLLQLLEEDLVGIERALDRMALASQWSAAEPLIERLLRANLAFAPLSFFAKAARACRALQRWDDAVEMVRQGLERNRSSAVLLRERAAIAIARSDWREAIAALERLRRAHPAGETGGTYLRLVQAYRRAGLAAHAARILEEAESRFPGRKDLKRERVALDGVAPSAEEPFPDALAKFTQQVADLRREGHREAALEAAKAALSLSPRSLPLQMEAIDVLIELGRFDEAFAFAQLSLGDCRSGYGGLLLETAALKARYLQGRGDYVVDYLARLEARFGQRVRRLPAASKPVIALCGFYYSGSTAVLDFLRQDPASLAWPPVEGEFRVLSHPGGFADLWQALVRCGRWEISLLAPLALSMFGMNPVAPPDGKSQPLGHVGSEFNRIAKSPYLGAWARACCRTLHFLADQAPAPAAAPAEWRERSRQLVADSLRLLLDHILEEAAPEAQRILLDQAPHVSIFSASLVMPKASFFVVARDPRDQFVDGNRARLRKGLPPFEAAYFVDRYRRLEAVVESHRAELQRSGHRLMKVRFEDFVRSPELRRRLAETCGIEWSALQQGKHFDAAVSSRNVGLHHAVPAPEIDWIAEQLPEFLVD